MSELFEPTGEWSWPCQVRKVGDRIELRPLHLQTVLSGEYIIDDDPDDLYHLHNDPYAAETDDD